MAKFQLLNYDICKSWLNSLVIFQINGKLCSNYWYWIKYIDINQIEYGRVVVVPYEGLHHLQMWWEVRQRQHRTRHNCVQLLRRIRVDSSHAWWRGTTKMVSQSLHGPIEASDQNRFRLAATAEHVYIHKGKMVRWVPSNAIAGCSFWSPMESEVIYSSTTKLTYKVHHTHLCIK